eukprot:6467133-Amphidinium_carterae.2
MAAARARHSIGQRTRLLAESTASQLHLLQRYASVKTRGSRADPSSLAGDCARRSTNRSLVALLDWQLQCVGRSLAELVVPDPVPTDLQKSKVIAHPDEARISIVHADGSTVWSLDCTEKAWLARPAAYFTLDCGPKSWAAISFLVWLGARCTHVHDVLHHLHNAWSTAVTHAGIQPVRQEWRLVMACRRGPFRQGGNHSLLREVADLAESHG